MKSNLEALTLGCTAIFLGFRGAMAQQDTLSDRRVTFIKYCSQRGIIAALDMSSGHFAHPEIHSAGAFRPSKMSEELARPCPQRLPML